MTASTQCQAKHELTSVTPFGLHATIASLALTHCYGITKHLVRCGSRTAPSAFHTPICGTFDRFHLFYLIPALVNAIQRSFEAFTGMGMR